VATVIYSLCAVTSLACLVLLWRSYRVTGSAMLFWSALCFLLLTANNVLLLLDKLVFTQVDLAIWRVSLAWLAVGVLVFGLIWGEE
jgi:hypothetical protein